MAVFTPTPKNRLNWASTPSNNVPTTQVFTNVVKSSTLPYIPDEPVDFLFSDGLDFLFSDGTDYLFRA